MLSPVRASFALLLITTWLVAASACSDDEGASPGADTSPDLTGDGELDLVSDGTPDAIDDATNDSVDDVADAIDADDLPPDDLPPDDPPLAWVPYVRGTFNNWEATDELVYVGDDVYAAVVAIAPGDHEFKIADEAWTTTPVRIFSASGDSQIAIELDTDVPLEEATGFSNNTEITIAEEADYTFALTVTVNEDDSVSMSLAVVQGAVVDPGELPDDSEVFTFGAQLVTPVTLEGRDGRPAPQALFDAMAIEVEAGETVQAVYGDNVDGYLEVWTQAYSSANAYQNASGSVFSYAASLAGASAEELDLNDLESESISTRILPYGVRNIYSVSVWDEVVLHPGSRAVSFRVHSDSAAVLGLIPRLALSRRTTTWERMGDTLVFTIPEDRRREGAPPYIAFASPQAFSVAGADLEARPALEETANIRATDIKPLFVTSGAETDFRVTMALGFSAAEARDLALSLAMIDAVVETQQDVYDLLTESYLETGQADFDHAVLWSVLSSWSMVNQEFGTGIWAGLPWFKQNWGRDTFIALPGTLLVTGRFETARAVIREFAALQNTDTEDVDYGRVPNRVASLDDIIYNTTDGTPWMVREIAETVRYTGDTDFAAEMYPVVQRYLDGAIENYADDDGFLTHDDADTWMDARFGPEAEYPWSARGDRAAEIQALWYHALRYGAELATAADDGESAAAWSGVADDLEANFTTLFWDVESSALADRVRVDDSRDLKLRPNQLMVVTIPFPGSGDRLLDVATEAAVVRNAAGGLLFEYGIASLSQDHDYFHPHHDNQPRFNKDAAYHNGTVWLWNAGFTVGGLARFGYQDHAYAVTDHMVGQLLERGARGSLSELVDAHPDEEGEVILSGTYSQSWSVAEFARAAFQDYVGFRPNLADDELALWPAPPSDWNGFEARLALGDGGELHVTASAGEVRTYELQLQGAPAVTFDLVPLAGDGSRQRMSFAMSPGVTYTVTFDPATVEATLGGEVTAVSEALPSQMGVIGSLELVEPDLEATYPTMESDDYLEGIIVDGEFE